MSSHSFFGEFIANALDRNLTKSYINGIDYK